MKMKDKEKEICDNCGREVYDRELIYVKNKEYCRFCINDQEVRMKQTKPKIKERIFKPINELDAEIRTIENDFDEDGTEYYVCELGTYESLGERGQVFTEIFDNKPTEKEIIERLKLALNDSYEDLNKGLLTWTEEIQLEILERFKRIGLI